MFGRTGVINSCKSYDDFLGRVGEAGQSNLAGFNANLDAAVRQFNSKFKAKTKLRFEDRQSAAKPGARPFTFSYEIGAYTYIERSYEEDSDGDTQTSPVKQRESVSNSRSSTPQPESSLDPSVQALVLLIFDIKIM